MSGDIEEVVTTEGCGFVDYLLIEILF